jgi:hypothetical protein
VKVALESTPTIVKLAQLPCGGEARRWTGATEGGIPVVAYIAAISPQTEDPAVLAGFAGELDETGDPRAPQTFEGRALWLADAVMRLIMPELKREPYSQDNVYAVLNALAAAAGTVIAGTGGETLEFFSTALGNNIAAASELDLFEEGRA